MTSGVGTCSVRYDQAGNANYNAAPQVTESVNASECEPGDHGHDPCSVDGCLRHDVHGRGDAAAARATRSRSRARARATNGGATFTITSGAGTCSVKYDQAGDTNYNAAPQVTESVSAQKANQAITVTTHAPASAAVYGSLFIVAATGGGSGNAVTFSSAGACSNVGATFTMTSGSGICTVRYDQAGNANYNAAPQVTESVNALKASQTITVTAHAPSSAAFGTMFTVAATGGGSGNPVTFSSAGPCTNSGATFTITSGAGTCSVRYDQAGNGNYDAAPQVTESVNAQKANQAISVTLDPPDGRGLQHDLHRGRERTGRCRQLLERRGVLERGHASSR